MSQTGQRPSPLAVGVDLGGTWLRLVALRDGKVIRRTRRTIPVSELSKFLPTQIGGPTASLVVAARGVGTPAERRAVARVVRGAAARIAVISDAEAALLGAHEGRAGLLVLAGTGSIVLGRDERGRVARAGGLGPLVGDEGSAFWLGREWLRRRPEAAMTARALGRRSDAVARVAALAPRALARARAGDRPARAILTARPAPP